MYMMYIKYKGKYLSLFYLCPPSPSLSEGELKSRRSPMSQIIFFNKQLPPGKFKKVRNRLQVKKVENNREQIQNKNIKTMKFKLFIVMLNWQYQYFTVFHCVSLFK